MAPPSRILVSSVVRGADQGDSHGGLYLVDLHRETFDQLLDWNDGSIDFDGRGGDRGLRGIVAVGDLVYVAASDELFAFDRGFRAVASWRNAYLKHCHEICEARGALYLTSTGFDSILRFNLTDRHFDLGIQVSFGAGGARARPFNPVAAGGPPPSMSLHLNNVHVDDFGIYVSGLKMPAILQIVPKAVAVFAEIPLGAHNARPFQGGVLLNDTDNDSVVMFSADRHVSIASPRYSEDQLLRADADASGIARQAFGRGLTPLSERIVVGGSSPTTVSVYDLAAGERLKSINISMDLRNAAHGVAVWPF
jgi:hypothetical protein